tara:strand:+ start:1269 stop:1427 length:159 start_codon:yes stop_codon:yes gene_type:complete
MCSLMDYKVEKDEVNTDKKEYVEDTLLEESPLTQTDEDDVVRECVRGNNEMQ